MHSKITKDILYENLIHKMYLKDYARRMKTVQIHNEHSYFYAYLCGVYSVVSKKTRSST